MVKTYKKGNKTKLSANFKANEFDCKCTRCSETLIDTSLVDILQKIRSHYGKSVNINSAYRCAKHNAEVGGASGSHHTKGMAADIVVKGIDALEVARYAESIGIKRIGYYDANHGNFVHIGSGTTKNFWKNTSSNKVTTFAEPKVQTVSVDLPILSRGDKGNAVIGMQRLLIGEGYDLEKDGSFGPGTEKVVEYYQIAKKLSKTKKVDAATWKSLLGI